MRAPGTSSSSSPRHSRFPHAGEKNDALRLIQADVAVGFLLALENGFVTGSAIDIDGGGLL
ncbi:MULTISPECIES: hypothetical protein [unclassified Serratia (in: enterobacteria)]|uniref:hypothetical protein n=1 Tax=unclassified Serratia (in: enterobacteria) TaxID=2647522 RepID=UPI0027FA7973|nr:MULTISPECIES: hypothetical protein [unclassified Serratia (in: enterobacteria)]MDQ7101280.1 hypothetical protein [Serratia sp. MF2]MDQ7102855.1 hypothetical protein [Serratia sp. MF1(2023)]